jgi:hypothetical protein
MTRRILALIVVVMIPHWALAQSAKNSWDNLKQLVPGDEIRIVLNDARSYQAKFESISDEAITVRLAAGEQSFARQDILRVSAKGNSHRLRNALIGAGIGAGIAGVGAGVNYSHDPESGTIAAVVGIPIGALVGAGVGAVMPTGGWHDVYRAASTPVRALPKQAGP